MITIPINKNFFEKLIIFLDTEEVGAAQEKMKKTDHEKFLLSMQVIEQALGFLEIFDALEKMSPTERVVAALMMDTIASKKPQENSDAH